LQHGPHAGRLLFIGHHEAYQYDGVWYSDDGGATYTMSKTTFAKMDEVPMCLPPPPSFPTTPSSAHHSSSARYFPLKHL
jgi:hypothetical protein